MDEPRVAQDGSEDRAGLGGGEVVLPTPYGILWTASPNWCAVSIERLAQLLRYRFVGVKTDRDSVDLYVTPTGKIRVFSGARELK